VHGGAVKSWDGAGMTDAPGPPASQPYAISWGPRGLLGFNWLPDSGGGTTFPFRLLDTGQPGGSLLAASHVLPVVRQDGLYFSGDAILSQAGDLVVVSEMDPHSGRTVIGEYSAATGALVRLLWPVGGGRDGGPPAIIVWSNRRGSVLAGYAPVPEHPRGAMTCGVIAGNHFTPIPGCPAEGSSGGWEPIAF
jgi:hypothetical protein